MKSGINRANNNYKTSFVSAEKSVSSIMKNSRDAKKSTHGNKAGFKIVKKNSMAGSTENPIVFYNPHVYDSISFNDEDEVASLVRILADAEKTWSHEKQAVIG